jgi:N-acetylglucosaminyl-diphospho-decaprenol L-rhamnosyltransferase
MSVMPADLDVIIVTYNSIHVIGDLLDSLPPALAGLTADVIVVDNGSSDGTAAFTEQRGGCRVVRSANAGYAAGINLGVSQTSGSNPVLVLNPDVRLHEGSVPPLLAALGEPGVGIAAPQIRTPAGRLDLTLRREPTMLRAMGLNWTKLRACSECVTGEPAYSSARVVDWAVGAALLMSRECYQALGGWDESFFLYSEETDLCLRARDMGFLTRYEPWSVVTHIAGGSGRNDWTHAMQIVNRVRLHRRRHGTLASWCYFWLAVMSELCWIARGRPQSKAAVVALLKPSRRPAELGCSDRLMPR